MFILVGMKYVIKNARENKGYTLQSLADKAGCNYSYLSLVENGKKVPGINMRNKLVEVLGLTHEEIRSDYDINK
jgi:transcriptional regulator with XRE-family HTH domain